MDFHTVRISLPFDVLGGKILLDDKEIQGVTKVSFEATVGGCTLVTLTLGANVEVEGQLVLKRDRI